VTYVDIANNETVVCKCKESDGLNLMTLAIKNKVEIEGACEGKIACSTCHVVLPQEYYDRLYLPSDEENDMLETAFAVEKTSRLGCQVVCNKAIDNIVVKIPDSSLEAMKKKK
jgi:ferredoxin